MSNLLGSSNMRVGPGLVKPTGLAVLKAKVAASTDNVPSPSSAKDRIGIVFDNSGSMGYGRAEGSTPIKDAKAGVEEFLRSCTKDQTAVCVYPFESEPINLTLNLPAVAIMVQSIELKGSTPLVEMLQKMLSNNPSLTRAIVFSDGVPDTSNIEKVIAKQISCDTVFIGAENDFTGLGFMRNLAEKTGGIFLHFDPSRSNFRTAFKYLSPGLRYMLADKSFVEKLEGK